MIPAAINVGLNYLLIPHYGMIGAAIATLISSVIYAAASFVVSQRLYYVRYNLAPFFKILAMTVGIIAIGYFWFSDISVANILIKIGLVGVFLICVYIFHLIGKDEVNYLKGLNYKMLLNPKTIISFFR